MEALACGTPVIAMRRGALPGIVEHGTTGFLVDGFLELAEALQRLDTLSPEACRRAALSRFDVRTTTERYLETYTRLAEIGAPGVCAPTAIARK
jgi:glycosyltransferase involved in cell wall biosynthesis